jgi:hypothetical protein
MLALGRWPRTLHAVHEGCAERKLSETGLVLVSVTDGPKHGDPLYKFLYEWPKPFVPGRRQRPFLDLAGAVEERRVRAHQTPAPGTPPKELGP